MNDHCLFLFMSSVAAILGSRRNSANIGELPITKSNMIKNKIKEEIEFNRFKATPSSNSEPKIFTEISAFLDHKLNAPQILIPTHSLLEYLLHQK